MERAIYRVISTPLVLPEETVTTYGIEVYTRDGVAEYPDIDVEKAAVERLAAILRREQVAFCHVAAVVEDYIEMLAGG